MTEIHLHPTLRALGLAAAAPLLAGMLLVGCGSDDTLDAAATTEAGAATDDSATDDSATDDSATDDSTATTEHEHDHGSDTTTAEHDHGTDDSTATEHAHSEGALDVEALHDLDDELADGMLDATAQRAVVAGYISQVEEMSPAAGSPEAELLKLLEDLDAALEAGDLATAGPLATQAHDAAHELGGHA